MNNNIFYLNRTIKKNCDTRTLHCLEWKLPNFFRFLSNETVMIMRTNKISYGNGVNKEFQIMIKYLGVASDLIKIYYMSEESLNIEYARITYYGRDITSYTAMLQHQLQKVKWHLLATEPRKKLIGENYSDTMIFTIEYLVRHNEDVNKEYLTINQYPQEIKDEKNTFKCHLADDIGTLLMKKAFADVTLKSVEGETFPAHKSLLFTRSAVLMAHFSHNTIETVTNVVEIPFETDVVKDILSYIYTDNAPNIDKLSGKLLEAAEFYQLDGLKELALNALEKKLTVENAIETLELANLYRANKLKKKTLEFIKNGLASKITITERWQNLKSSEALLVKSIYEFVVNNIMV